MLQPERPQAGYMTVNSIAALLAMHRNTVIRWCKEGVWQTLGGRNAAIQIGTRWRVQAASFNRWLHAQHRPVKNSRKVVAI